MYIVFYFEGYDFLICNDISGIDSKINNKQNIITSSRLFLTHS